MSAFDDNQDMRAQSDELLLTGHAVPDEPGLVDLVAAVRRSVDAPAPRPSPALSMLLRDGLAAVPARGVPVRRRLQLVGRYIAGLGLAAKIALGAGIAFAGVTGAATIGAVPDVIQVPARAVVHGVEHLFAPGSGDPVTPVPASSSADGRAAETPRPSSNGQVPAVSGRGAAPRPTPQEASPGESEQGRSSQAGRPGGGTPTLPAQAQATENAVPGTSGAPGSPAVPGGSVARGQSDGAPSPSTSPSARAESVPTHPWESSSVHLNSNG